MANSYSVVTARSLVPCTVEDFHELDEILKDSDQEESHGIKAEHSAGSLYLATDDSGSSTPDNLSKEFLTKLGEILTKASMPWLEFGVANICDKFQVNSHGGTYFRIYPDGEVVWASLSFPKGGKPELSKSELQNKPRAGRYAAAGALLARSDAMPLVSHLIMAADKFVDVIEATGGLLKTEVGYVPKGDEDWLDLGDAALTTMKALKAAGLEVKLSIDEGDDSDV